jgi:hypothetical protein
MAETWRYRGQEIDSEQIVFLREFIRTHPTSSRWKLSRQLCEALGWKQANGALRDMICRGLLLMLERAGQIELPPVRCQIRGQCRTGRRRPEAVLIETGAETEYGENQCRSASRCAGRQPQGRRIRFGRPRTAWCRCVYRRPPGFRRACHAPRRRQVSRVPEG